jgi:imidazoleglycerol-phosphate dehydratase
LVECSITKGREEETTTADSMVEGNLQEYTLAPYGTFPKATGRTKIGHLETAALEHFWKHVAQSSGLTLAFRKYRGINAHHIVESSFKAFSRALRKLIDDPQTFGVSSSNDVLSQEMNRVGKVSRSTKETSIEVDLQLKPTTTAEETNNVISTGIPFLDQFLSLLAKEATMTLAVQCTGDLWVDEHHTAEDVSIAIGQCLTAALGTKAGLNRMWVETASLGTAKVQVTMDLSNRPCWDHDFHGLWETQEYIDPETLTLGKSPLSCEMMEHVFESLITNSRMTVHFRCLENGSSLSETMLCAAMAFGKALRVCAMVDARRAGKTASSKGTLSA